MEQTCVVARTIESKVKVVKLELEIELAKFDNVETLKKIMIDTSKPEKEVLFLISQGVFLADCQTSM